MVTDGLSVRDHESPAYTTNLARVHNPQFRMSLTWLSFNATDLTANTPFSSAYRENLDAELVILCFFPNHSYLSHHQYLRIQKHFSRLTLLSMGLYPVGQNRAYRPHRDLLLG